MATKTKSKRLYCSRFFWLKSKATQAVRKLKAMGATAITLTGSRRAWRVRCRINVLEFAQFCADEAREASKD